MDVSTFNLPPSSPSWDSTSARAAAGQTEANEHQAAPKPNEPPASDSTDQPQSEASRFSSPVIGVDAGTGSTFLEYRNQNTGVPYAQVPSQAALQYAEAVATSPVSRSIEQIETSEAHPVRRGSNVIA